MSDAAVLIEAMRIGRRPASSSKWLLQDVSAQVLAGDRICIVGPSGAGKTLLLRSLALLDPLDSGTVRWHGAPIVGPAVPRYRSRVIYLQQRATLVEGTVEANLRVPFELSCHAKHQFDAHLAVELLSTVGRGADFLGRLQRDLSGGEAQLVAFIRALQLDPRVLLLDEPTGSLDSETAASIEMLVARWIDGAPHERAFVWVTHSREQAQRVSNAVWSMSAGHLRKEAVG